MEINTVNLVIFTQGSSVSRPSRKEAVPPEESIRQEKIKEADRKTTEIPEKIEVKSNRAFIDVDENEHVVIKVVDSEGKLVKQLPSEQHLRAIEYLESHLSNLFEKEA